MPKLPSYVEHYSDRADWGGGPVNAAVIAVAAVIGWVLHHTVFVLTDYDRDGFLRGDVDDVRRYMRVLQKARPDLGSEVPYSWVIFPGSRDDTCIIAEGRGRGRRGAHTAGLNSTRYAFAIAGNTDADMPITPGMAAGMRWLAAVMLVDPAHAVRAIGHQQAPPYMQGRNNLNATGCPGNQGLSMLPLMQPPYTIPAPLQPPTPGGNNHMIDTATLPLDHPSLPGRGVEARVIDGDVRLRAQVEDAGGWGPFTPLGSVVPTPTKVDSVNLRADHEGRLTVIAWHTSAPTVVYVAWQPEAGGDWVGWLGW